MDNKKELKVNFPPDFKGGSYANNMVVSHTKDEFIMDFLMIAHPVGIVNSRVITNPSQVKRIVKALEDNISKYEKKFGEIDVSDVPTGNVDFEQALKQ